MDPAYDPADVFGGARAALRRALIAPARYIQGPDAWDELGRYLPLAAGARVALLWSRGGEARFGLRLRDALAAAGLEAVGVRFGGECSVAEIDRVLGRLGEAGAPVEAVVAVGGGKCIDAAKAVAWRVGVAVAACPSIASTDAPCSALAVIYSDDGSPAGAERYPDGPAVVAVDTSVIARAPARYLVAGMGDALATRYEARTCVGNPEARSGLGARPTLAAAVIAEACATTLYADGVAARDAAERGEVTAALERVVEVNTLLSGIGFESGGVAAAHCVASGLTALPRVRERALHGELVAIGLLAQLVLEDTPDDARRVVGFCAEVGLPVHLGQIGLEPEARADLRSVAERALTLPFAANEPFPVTVPALVDALLDAHALGVEVSAQAGDAPYRRLRAGTAPADDGSSRAVGPSREGPPR